MTCVIVRNLGCINCSHDIKSTYPFYTEKIILSVANTLQDRSIHKQLNTIKSECATSIHSNNCSWVIRTYINRTMAETGTELRLVRVPRESHNTHTSCVFLLCRKPAKFEMPINVPNTQDHEATKIACTQLTPQTPPQSHASYQGITAKPLPTRYSQNWRNITLTS